MVSKGFLNVVTLGQQYNIGEKPTVILYTNINRHAGTPTPQSRNLALSASLQMVDMCFFHIIYSCYNPL